MQNIHLGEKTTRLNNFMHNFDGSVNAISYYYKKGWSSLQDVTESWMTDKQDCKTVILRCSGVCVNCLEYDKLIKDASN